MGQQQLLLIVLSTIIVGISIAVGINMVTSSAGQANFDAVMQDLVTLGERSRGWHRQPALMGGGGGTFAAIAADADMVNFLGWALTNENGVYSVDQAGTVDSVRFLGVGIEDLDGDGTDLTIRVNVGQDGMTTTVINR